MKRKKEWIKWILLVNCGKTTETQPFMPTVLLILRTVTNHISSYACDSKLGFCEWFFTASHNSGLRLFFKAHKNNIQSGKVETRWHDAYFLPSLIWVGHWKVEWMPCESYISSLEGFQGSWIIFSGLQISSLVEKKNKWRLASSFLFIP